MLHFFPEFLDTFVKFSLLPLSLLFFIFGIDDLIISILLWWYNLTPSRLSREEFLYIYEQPEKPLAILVAAWKEAGVLSQMVRGNINLLNYEHVDFYLGVYPNDPYTVQEALALQNEFKNVYVVTNSQPGPTTKGQMINELVKSVFTNESNIRKTYQGFVIHDSEDLINSHSLKIMSWLLNEYDLIQIPVFSLPVSSKNWVAGTYIDEFAEAHTRDLLVRSHLKLPIPSAGVGTALSRKLVQKYRSENGGGLLNGDTVTEDYELGVSTGKYGLKSFFACYFLRNESTSGSQKTEFIATREYFPKAWNRSVRQKTRWVLGVALQGWSNLGWSGNLANRYFLYRDRKGPISNLVSGLGVLVFGISIIRGTLTSSSSMGYENFILPLLSINLALMILRMVGRFRSVYWIYGLKTALLSPLRFPIASIINALASVRAIGQYIRGRSSNRPIQWVKTEHELPDGFGLKLKPKVEQ